MSHYDTSLLNEALNDSTMNLDALKIVNIMKKAKVNKVHSYVVTSPKDISSRWQTYIKSEDGKRKKISAMSEDALYDKLYEHYFFTVKALQDLYPQWLEKRRHETISSRTIIRNQQHWRKYYENTSFVAIPLAKIAPNDIENFLYSCINKHPMSYKTLNNMRFIVKDMLKFAYRKGLIKDNPFNDAEVKTSACIPEVHKNDSSRVYNKIEVDKLFNAISVELSVLPQNTDAYAILILFKLGLRIGEVSALKFSDIDYINKEIHIHRMETLDLGTDGKQHPIVVNHTKKRSPYGDRYLPIGEYELKIFEKVKVINIQHGYKDDDFIFCDSDGRTQTNEIDKRLRKLCRKAKIEVKSAHDIRRTVASEMHKNGIPLEMIRQYLGHSTIETTIGYIYNNNTKDENRRLIQNALSSLNRTS
ncbi:tyrosine-type recombinase/integrase [Clostridium manihotivorum]|uniref:Tyr recombinase domain-containing protein n=1 Tax=Clostridium manihotivorum TaxID=2320868 RepID=A0A410DP91_9CLOT|nr:site-specific integrase [Clostridium manihotivorum]QAA30953.1 hypothetical protein C1I91_04325 [Clostridium manihotivorum]